MPKKKTKSGSLDDSAIKRAKQRKKKLKDINSTLWPKPKKKKK